MTRTRTGLVLLPGLLLALTLTVAACGGGTGSGVASLGEGKATPTTSPGGSSDPQQAARNFARCMRQHGISLPDPQVTGDDIVQQLPGRAEQDSPRFKAAQEACRQFLPNGGRPSPPSARAVQQARQFARCLRQHGIDLPDPQVSTDGIDQQPPRRVHPDDPRLKAAEQACQQYGSLPPVVKPGGPQSGGGAK